MRQMIVGSDDDGLHAKITSLNMAVAHGHIRQEQADERLRLLQNSTGGVTTMIDEVPCRVNKRGQTVRVWKDQFCPMPGHIYPDRAAAVRAVRKGKVEHGGNGGEWASNTFFPSLCQASTSKISVARISYRLRGTTWVKVRASIL